MITRHLAVLLLAAGTLVSSPPLMAADPSGAAAVKRGKPVAAGDVAPDFTLVDRDGRKHTLSAERRKRPVVLVFYRGHW